MNWQRNTNLSITFIWLSRSVHINKPIYLCLFLSILVCLCIVQSLLEIYYFFLLHAYLSIYLSIYKFLFCCSELSPLYQTVFTGKAPVLELRRVESHPFVAITLRSTLTWNCCTCFDSIYGLNISIWTLFIFDRNISNHINMKNLFLLLIVTWSYNCLQETIILIYYLKPEIVWRIRSHISVCKQIIILK